MGGLAALSGASACWIGWQVVVGGLAGADAGDGHYPARVVDQVDDAEVSCADSAMRDACSPERQSARVEGISSEVLECSVDCAFACWGEISQYVAGLVVQFKPIARAAMGHLA